MDNLLKKVKNFFLGIWYKIKEIWRASGQLKKRYYIKLSSIVWTIFMITSPIMNLYDDTLHKWFVDSIEITGVIKQLIVYIPWMYACVRFYPWVKEWCKTLPIINKLFPVSQMNGFWNAVKYVFGGTITIYKSTPYDYIDYYDRYGFHIDTEKRTMEKTSNSGIFFIEQLFIAIARLTVLFEACLLSIFLGWFAVPSVLKRVGYPLKKNKELVQEQEEKSIK